MRLSPRTVLAVFFITIGLSTLFQINIGGLIVPLIIIFIGYKLLYPGKFTPDKWIDREESKENTIDFSEVFTGLEKKVKSHNFQGGKIDLIFGGGTLDLRESDIPAGESATLEVNSVFGGIKILVPSSWTVSTSVVGIFGGFANNTNVPQSASEQGRLLVKGASIFGGGEVTN